MDLTAGGPTHWIALAAVQALAIAGLAGLIPAYLAHGGASNYLVGWAFTSWAVTRAAFGLAAGRAFTRFGARNLLLCAYALFALATGGYALSHSPDTLVGLRLLQGAAAGLYWTSLLAAAAAEVPPRLRLAALARVNVAAATAGLISNALAGAVAAAFGPQVFFWAECALLVLVGLPLTLALPSKRVRPTASPTKADAIHREAAAARERNRGRLPGSTALRAGLAAVANLPIVVTAVGAPVLLLRAGAGYPLVGAVTAAMILANIGSQFAAGRFGDRVAPGQLLAGAAAATTLFLCLLPLARGPLTIALVCVLLAGALSLTALGWLSWTQRDAPSEAIGPVTGLLRGLCDLSGVVAFTAFGFIAAHLAASLWTIGAVVLATGIAALRLDRPHRAT